MKRKLEKLLIAGLARIWNDLPLGLRHRLVWIGAPKFAVSVSTVCLNPRGLMLVLERRFAHGDAWGLPGGILVRGEQPLAGLVREFREETGLDLAVEELLGVEGGDGWIHISYLSRVPDGEPELQQSEHLGYRWVDPTVRELETDVYDATPVRLVAARLVHQRIIGVKDAQ